MVKKFKNKYRIESTRLQNWDYGWQANYFITICTKNREHYFGEISEGKMQLSKIGEIAETEWQKTFEMRPDMNLFQGEFVVMPNHFHAVIGIGENQYNTDISTMHCGSGETTMHCGSGKITMHCDSTDKPKNKFGPQSKNLAAIVRGFKSAVTINARKINPYFCWQSLFHDSIIRNKTSFDRVKNYIINNPLKWKEDDYHKK